MPLKTQQTIAFKNKVFRNLMGKNHKKSKRSRKKLITTETAVTRSYIGTLASARARLAQVIAAAKSEPSLSKM